MQINGNKKWINLMVTSKRSLSGLLFFLGGVQWFFVVLLTEGMHPGYNSATYYVSSLGVGNTAMLYNYSTIFLGILVLLAGYLFHESQDSKVFTFLLAVTGLSVIGVGVFPENVRPMHGYVTPIALLFGGFSAIYSVRFQSSWLRYFYALLGVITLASGIFFNYYLGLPRESLATFMGFAKGTLERVVIYPILLWIISLGSSLAVIRK